MANLGGASQSEPGSPEDVMVLVSRRNWEIVMDRVITLTVLSRLYSPNQATESYGFPRPGPN